jgi:Asp-tRNA(Asn)/Glu-tRNA(Gln) amidotransferase A subunit family amidase
MSALTDLSATAAAEAIRAGEVSSETLVRACLERIAEREHTVHAWAHIDQELALAQARARDAEAPAGPLHGVPVGVKDLIDTADQPTAYGSPIYADRRPGPDAECVIRLRSAGAVILGKTVTTEFALFHPGPTTNPHDPARTPGGSSSGSAAAVADRMVPLALGTQTAASIIRPAAFCGVFGLKPTYGAVPTGGVKVLSPSLDTIGAFARDAADLAVALAVLSDQRVVLTPEPPRVAWVRTFEWDLAAVETRRALEALAGELALPEVVLPDDFAELVAAQTAIMEAEVAHHLAPERQEHGDQLSAKLHTVLASGDKVTDERLHAAHELARRCRAQVPGLFGDADVLLAPCVIGEAPVGVGATGDPLFCRIWTLLGTPTVAVPGLRGPAGLPLGVQVVAPSGDDALAIGAAQWLARQLG